MRNARTCQLNRSTQHRRHTAPPGFLSGTPFDPYWGYPLIGIGIFLLLLNLVDSFNQITKSDYHFVVKIFVFSILIVVTCWLAMVVWFFRMR
jgi:hypothetical protein